MTTPFRFTTSWDDGTVHDLRLAELLSKYDLPATFYIARRHPFGPLPDKEIRELATRFELGAHTLNHPVLTKVPDDVAATEIEGSKLWIEQLTGKPCPMFCFPRGKFRKSHLAMARNAGFRGARTVEMMSCATPRLVSGIALVPTTIQAFPHRILSYLRNIAQRRRPANFRMYCLHATENDWVSLSTAILNQLSLRGGVFHLWGHAWEINKHNLWDGIDRLFRTAKEMRQVGDYVTNGNLVLAA